MNEVIEAPAVLAPPPKAPEQAPTDPQAYAGTSMEETGYETDAAGTALG